MDNLDIELKEVRMAVLVLKEHEMAEVITMKEVIESDKKALAMYSGGKSNIPLRINLSVPKHGGNSLYMPGYAEDADALGLKIVSVYPGNPALGLPSVPGSMILLDAKTGTLASIMDGSYLTKLRTGALSGAATDLLARKDASTFMIIGVGGQAECQVEAVLAVRNIKKVYVAATRIERAEAFAAKMKERYAEKYGVDSFEAIEDINSHVADCDIISCATTSFTPVFDGTKVKKGCHINGVGSYTPDMLELPREAIARANKVYFDTMEGVINEAGDIMDAISSSALDKEKGITGELGALVLGNIKGRENDEEITLFKSTGTAVLDLVVAKAIYDKARDCGKGSLIEL